MKKLFNIFKNPKVIRGLIILFIVGVFVGGYMYLQTREGRVFIDSSSVEAPLINISPDSPGKVLEMDIEEGDNVGKGAVLAIVGSQTLKSYTDGVVVKVNNEVGSNTSAQTPVIQMIDPLEARVVGTIDENKGLADLKPGQVVKFTVDAFPGKTYFGYVDRIAPSAKQTQIAFSISNERPVAQFDVFASFNPSSYPELKNGMSAKMVIFTKTN